MPFCCCLLLFVVVTPARKSYATKGYSHHQGIIFTPPQPLFTEDHRANNQTCPMRYSSYCLHLWWWLSRYQVNYQSYGTKYSGCNKGRWPTLTLNACSNMYRSNSAKILIPSTREWNTPTQETNGSNGSNRLFVCCLFCCCCCNNFRCSIFVCCLQQFSCAASQPVSCQLPVSSSVRQ